MASNLAEKNCAYLKTQAYGGKGEVLTHITWNDYRIKLEYLFACNDQKAKFTMPLKVEQGLISLKNFPLKNVVKNSLQKKNPI